MLTTIRDVQKEERKPPSLSGTLWKQRSRHIPHHVMHDLILLKLPVKSLTRFKLVCKSWRSLISDPKFIKSHLTINANHHNTSYIHLSVNDDHDKCPCFYINTFNPTVSLTSIANNNEEGSEIKQVDIDYPFEYSSRRGDNCNVVLGSCNGLLLITSNDQTILWNPTTTEHVKTSPTRNLWAEYPYKNYVSRLGYDLSNDEYKAVISFLYQRRSHMFIFRSRIGHWKEVDEANIDLPWSIINYVSYALGNTVNGAPHWVVIDRSNNDLGNKSRTIIYFDTVEEKFKKLPSPTTSWWNDMPDVPLHYSMAVLEGRLCIVHKISGDDHFNFWVMKEYGVAESWTKLFVIRHSSWNMVPLGLTNNGDEVVLQICRELIVTYNLKIREEKSLVSTRRNFVIDVCATYVESLVFPMCNSEKEKRNNQLVW